MQSILTLPEVQFPHSILGIDMKHSDMLENECRELDIATCRELDKDIATCRELDKDIATCLRMGAVN